MGEILTPDICIIGAGSGGLSVAAIAAAFGVSVVLIEKGKMGGDCLNYGCVPSKALIASAKSADVIRHSGRYGIHAPEPVVDFQKVHDYVHSVIGAIAPNDSVERFTSMGVHVIEGAAKFVNSRVVEVNGTRIRARRFVVATGSSAAVPPIKGLQDVPFLTNENIFERTEAPDHLIIIGGGPIGMEMAQAHRRLGAQVTVVEAFTALAHDDPELTEIVIDKLRQDGIVIREKVKIARVEKAGSGIAVVLEAGDDEEVITGSHLLVAAGRKPNVEGLGLKDARIRYDRAIKVSKSLRTSNRRVYAIGDVAGSLQFTHMANYHAGLVIRAILFRLPIKENRHIIPWATYTDPELAHVGLAEEQARKKHRGIKVLRWPYAENDRAQTEGKTSGLIKVVVSKRGKILGASIVGYQAGEMINMWSLAISQKMKIGAISGYIAPYPTVSEISKRAAITHLSGAARNKWVQRIIHFLRRFN
uniref:dihydrolipoyl dehydrogenase family protein n=1 Tax=Pararhizobium sp. IMCC3301 TaxID=3067904 RepID=UPI0027422A34|nr:FAD-dependent oxidoreductase [Pararhizobium sp. IMCC3301]